MGKLQSTHSCIFSTKQSEKDIGLHSKRMFTPKPKRTSSNLLGVPALAVSALTVSCVGMGPVVEQTANIPAEA